MNKIHKLFLFFFLMLAAFVNGQDSLEAIPLLTPRLSNVQAYTPSVLLSKGQTEVKMFNSLYSQTQFFNEDGSKVDAGGRSSFFTTITEYNYGLSSRVSLGGELWFRSTSTGAYNSSLTNVLTFSNSSSSRTGITLAGFKIKYNPVQKWERFSVQSGILLSVISDPQSTDLDRPFLDNNRHLWVTKFLYDKRLSSKFQLFTQLTSWLNIDKNLSNENTSLAVPVDLFISYFPNKKLTIYLQNQVWPSLGSNGLSSYFIQEGLGLKYQLFRGVELEASYTTFVAGENVGAGQTINMGVRILN